MCQSENCSDEKKVNANRLDRVINEAFETITQLAEYDPATKGRKKWLSVPTGFLNIDQHTGGLWPGELTVVTGGPGVGKSSFAANIAITAAKVGAQVLYVTLATNAIDAVIRMCASEGRLKANNLFRGSIAQDDWSSLADASNKLSKLDLYICDDPNLTLAGLLPIAHEISEGPERSLIVIDGAELLIFPDMDYICDWPPLMGAQSYALKKLARETESPVLVTMAKRHGTPYAAFNYESALSGLPHGVEFAADSVIHIERHLAKTNPDDIPSQTVAKCLIAKGRMCAPTETKLAFVPEYMHFMDYVDDPRMGC